MSILERRKAKTADLLLAGPIAALAVTGLFNAASRGSSISSSDLLVFQAGTSTTADATTASPLILDDLSLTNNTAPVQSWNLSNGAAGSDNLYTSSNGSNGQLALSNNGSIVTFGAYVGSGGAAVEDLQVQRDAVAINAAGTLSEPTSYNEPSASLSGNQQVRSAATLDGTNYVFGNKDGTYINNGASAVNGTNILEVADYGGTLYAASNTANTSLTPGFFSVNPNGTSNTVYTFSAGSGTTTFSGVTDFVLLKSGNNGSTYDTLYAAVGKKIEKFSVSGTTLTLVGTDTLAGTGALGASTDGITGVEVGNTTTPIVDLFLTTPGNGTTGASVEEIVDSTAYSANIGNVAAASLYTTGVATNAVALYGISIAPTSHSAVTTFSSSPPSLYTEATGTSNPATGGKDINVTTDTNGLYVAGYLNKINGGAGLTKGYVTVGGMSANSPAVIALSVQIKAYTDTSSRSLSSDAMALSDVVADLQAGASAGVTVVTFSSLSASQIAAFSAEAGNGGNSFDIALVGNVPSDFSWDFSNEGVDGLTSITVTDIAVVPEPASAAVFAALGFGLLRRRRRRVAAATATT
jgi:hypothetical protein